MVESIDRPPHTHTHIHTQRRRFGSLFAFGFGDSGNVVACMQAAVKFGDSQDPPEIIFEGKCFVNCLALRKLRASFYVIP